MADLIMGRMAYQGIITNSITGDIHRTQRYTFYSTAREAAEKLSKKYGGEVEIIVMPRKRVRSRPQAV